MADRNLNIIINAIDNASGQLKGIDSALERNKATIQKTTLAATAAFAGIAVSINKAVQEAGNAEKIAVNFENTFGESADTINSFISDFGDRFAFVESEMRDGANSIGFQLNAMGEIGQEQGEEMTKSLLTASGALSDFFGGTVDVTQAANAMAKGLAGNRQQLIDMGFNVLQEDIEKAAERMGIFSDELTKAQEAQVFTNLIMEQTTGSVEGLNSTFDTFTGQQRALDKAVTETTQTLGEVFIPIATELLAAVRPVIERVAAWIEQNPELTRNIVIAAAAITGLVAVMGMLTLTLMAFNPVSTIIIGAIAGLTLAFVGINNFLKKLGIGWGDVWEGIKSTTVRVVGAVVTLVEGMINNVISGINGVIRLINRVIAVASKVPGFKGASGLTISEISEVDFGGAEMLRTGKMGGDTVNVTVNGDVSGEQLVQTVSDRIMGNLSNNVRLSPQ